MPRNRKLLAEIISRRLEAGETKTQIRADLEAERGKPFTAEEWATYEFGACFGLAVRLAAREAGKKKENPGEDHEGIGIL